MTAKSASRPVRDRNARTQERGERTRALVIEETIRCIREEGFAAASTRHIIDRAGVSWGVIQYYFGDRDGLLTAVIDHANTTLTASLEQLADTAAAVEDPQERAESLSAAAWKVFFSPICMTALEILIATRAMQGTLSSDQLSGVLAAIERIGDAIGGDTPHSTAIANLLWSSPVGMMVAQMVTTEPLPTDPEQHAMAALISDHLDASQRRATSKAKPRRRTGR
ncbi:MULTISPECIES: TetR/AcrR family transcriptional regulator [unclassified Mycobacterium]|uniref:TetR/AcrR family transcriptional regulator n=1 Tax=unclassified Mycobacterium TaxID=2642494 RepID=UPI0029C98726|nr:MULTISPECIES: TetR/AcrR family transcriptional regulator [unclassified Mycobacterium]